MMHPGSLGHSRLRHVVSGFSLTELVVVMAVLALLTALAIPNYKSFVMKSRRTEAKELLYTAAQRQQQYFTMFNRYADTAAKLAVPTSSTSGYYNLTIAVGTTGSINTSYLVTATPASGTTQTADSACYTFGLNSLGTKTVSGSQTTPPCW